MTNLFKLKTHELVKVLKNKDWRVLIADIPSRDILLSILPLNEILQLCITQIKLLEECVNVDDGDDSYDKLYFILPTTHSIDRVIRSVQKSKTPSHLYLLDNLSKQLEFKLIHSGIIPRLSTLSELPLNFQLIESRAFTSNQLTAFNSYYSKPSNVPSSELQVALTVKTLQNMLLSLNINPTIIYQNAINGIGTYSTPIVSSGKYLSSNPTPPPTKKSSWKSTFSSSEKGSGVARRVAVALSKELAQVKRDNHDFGLANTSSQPILLITDRTLDISLPLLHEFTYQSLTNDVLSERSLDTIAIPPLLSYKSSTGIMKQHAVSDNSDSIWSDIRHLHMKDAIDKVGNLAREAEKADSDLKNAKGLDGLRSMLAGLTDLQDIKEKAFIHTNLSDQLMAEVTKRHLMQVSEVEQCCATGTTSDGRTPRHLIEQMVPLLDQPNLLNKDKIRIISLYIIFKDGVSDEDKRRLYQHARLGPSDQQSIDNLVHLGIKVSKNDGEQQGYRRYKYKGKSEEDVYDTSRYVPALKTALMDLLSGKLDTGIFTKYDGAAEGQLSGEGDEDAKSKPLQPPPGSLRNTRQSGSSLSPTPHHSPTPAPSQGSLRSARATWASASRTSSHTSESAATKMASRSDKDDDKRQKILVFVCGGMTYGEIRSVYELSNTSNRDILIGSTDILTPIKFLENVRKLDGGYMYGQGSTQSNEASMKFSGASTALGKVDRYAYDPGSELSDKRRVDIPDLTPEQVEQRYYKNLQQGYDRKYWSEEVKPVVVPQPVVDEKGKPVKPKNSNDKKEDKKEDKKDEKRLKKEQKEIEKHMAKQQEAEKRKEKKWGKKGWF